MLSWLLIKGIACGAALYGGYRIWDQTRACQSPVSRQPVRETSKSPPTNPSMEAGTAAGSLSEAGPAHLDNEERLLKVNETHLQMTGLALASSVGAAILGSPLLFVYGASVLTWAIWPRCKEGARKLVEEHRTSGDLLYTVLVPLTILSGQLVGGSLAAAVSILGDRYKIKTENHVRSNLGDILNSQFDAVWLQTPAGEKQVPLSEVQPDDVVVVHTGDMVPVDGTVIEGFATIDQHILTGESQPVEKAVGDKIFASTVVIAGKVYTRVDHTGAETAVAHLARILGNTLHYTTQHVESRAVQCMDTQSLPVLIAAGGTAALGRGLAAISLMTAWTPGRLRLTAGLSMLNYMQTASKRGILIKDGRALELLSDIDVVIFDKTGTLTNHQPNLHDIHCFNGYAAEEILRYAAAAEGKLTHPVARAIQQKAAELRLTLPEQHQSAYDVGYGIRMLVEGRSVRVGSEMFMRREGVGFPSRTQQLATELHDQGHSTAFVAIDDALVGLLELRASLRPEAGRVIRSLRDLGTPHISIMSGDHWAPTARLASQLKVDSFMAEMLPKDKAGHIHRLQQQGKVVCFIGDGINDSIALKQAHVGISMTGASRIATETAHIVLLNPNLSSIVDLFAIGQDVRRKADENLWLSSWIPGTIGTGLALMAGASVVPIVMVNGACLAVGINNAMKPLELAEEPTSCAAPPLLCVAR